MPEQLTSMGASRKPLERGALRPNPPARPQTDWLLVLTVTFFLLALLIVWLVGVPALFD